jgi:hypothetical protein
MMRGVDERFIPGLQLSTRFYEEVVAGLLRKYFDGLTYTAARIGHGSEVLGFDTERSADHEWGPRLQIFLRPEDDAAHADAVREMLSERLPKTFLGWPTHYADVGEGAVREMQVTDGPVFHRIDVANLGAWYRGRLGFDPRVEVTPDNWLDTPTQMLAEETGGTVMHDGLGELEAARARLAWYPDDVWRYVLALHWQRISDEEAFVGRTGEVGDELGSAIVAARLTRDLIRLALLITRRYPPYSKWLGSAFSRLPIGAELNPVLIAALAATDWHERERHLAIAYERIAAAGNELGLSASVDPSTRNYHSRPFRVLHAERFAAALVDSITDQALAVRFSSKP